MTRTASRSSRRLVAVVDVLAGDALGSIVAIEEFARSDAGIEPIEVRRVLVYRIIATGLIDEGWMLDEDQSLMDGLCN